MTHRVVHPITDLATLLLATDCADIDELRAAVVDSLESEHQWLTVDADNAEEVSLHFTNRGIGLTDPFIRNELW